MPNTRHLLPLALLLAVPAGASDLQRHRVVTADALRGLGWDRNAIQAVVHANLAVDLVKLPPPLRTASSWFLPSPGEEIDPVRTLAATAPFCSTATWGFHFNGLSRFDAIGNRWRAMDAWARARAAVLAPPRRLMLLGLVAHAVQDFYEHSNWVDILREFAPPDADPRDLPLWEELVEDEGAWCERHPRFPAEEARNRLRASNAFVSLEEDLGGLQTGSSRTCPGPGWSHRHHTGEERDAVEALARRGIARWARILVRTGPDPGGGGRTAR